MTNPPPSPQKNYELATERGFDALTHQAEEQLLWLGAQRDGSIWRLPVFNDIFEVDISARRMTTAAGEPVRATWRILALHYLAITGQPECRVPDTTFADLSAARSYSGIYQGRVIYRLCATAGRNADTLRAAAESLGGREPADAEMPTGDAAFDFNEFPRVSLRLIWHAADDEFPPSATLLLPSNIEEHFCSEDIVVLSECLVAKLCGRPY